jgi:hypothetical protein
MGSRWTDRVRHCMHILATHYPASDWHDRAAILNLVCVETLTANQVRDEYGGHVSGRRNRPGNVKATRSLMWNDEICRDEFGLPGPFNQAQQITRGTILRDIQAAIVTLGLGNNPGLGAVNLVVGMDRANVALATAGPGAPAPAAPVPTTSAATTAAPLATLAGPSTTAATAQAGPSTATSGSLAGTKRRRDQNDIGDEEEVDEEEGDQGAGDEGDDNEGDSDAESDGSCDPEEGGAAWYHSREIRREDRYFVYRDIVGLPYSDEPPEPLFARWVFFPARGMRAFKVQVCTVGGCDECGPLRSDSDEEDDEEAEEDEEDAVEEEQDDENDGDYRG